MMTMFWNDMWKYHWWLLNDLCIEDWWSGDDVLFFWWNWYQYRGNYDEENGKLPEGDYDYYYDDH